MAAGHIPSNPNSTVKQTRMCVCYTMSSPYSSLYEDRRDANERGESNLTHAVRYFSSTTPYAQDCNYAVDL